MATLDNFPSTEASPKLWQPTTAAMEQETQSFPLKLHAMLDEASDKNVAHIVAWQEGGKSFKVYDSEAFATEVMRSYFNQTKYKSFQRQLNLYGFRRIHHGPQKGGYSHKFFMRGQPHLTKVMSRHKVTRGLMPAPASAPSSPATSSNKPLLASFTTVTPKLKISSSGSIFDNKADVIANSLMENDDPDDHEIELFSEFFKDTEQYLFEERQSMNLSMGASEFEALMNTISAGDETEKRQAKRHLRLSFSGVDYDNLISSINNLDQPDISSSHMGSLDEIDLPVVCKEPVVSDSSAEEEDEEHNRPHSFPWKLHEMLEDAEKNNFQDVVSWELDGTAFKVHKHDEFLQRIMPIYFDQTKYESFRRQLNLYGFSRVSRGPHRGIYLHKFFLRNDRPLCENIARHKTKSSSVR